MIFTKNQQMVHLPTYLPTFFKNGISDGKKQSLEIHIHLSQKVAKTKSPFSTLERGTLDWKG